jgi:hypothetical protein
MDEFIKQNLNELSKGTNKINDEKLNIQTIPENILTKDKNKTIKDLVYNLNEIKTNDNKRVSFFNSIFRNKPNNNIQIEYLHEFNLEDINVSLDDLFTKESILVNNAFCSNLFHINLNKYITQYISFLVFDNPHYHLVFKNMPFMKKQIYGMKEKVKKELLNKCLQSGDIVNVLLKINFNVKNIDRLTEHDIKLFKSKEIKNFQITFLIK